MRVTNMLGSIAQAVLPIKALTDVFKSYPDDAAYIADPINGAAVDGSAYYNTTENVLRTYRDGLWYSQYGRIDKGVLHLGDPETDGTVKILNNAGVFEIWERVAGTYVLRSSI